jgi:asparagine synthase (glutamine-hydrolysing)
MARAIRAASAYAPRRLRGVASVLHAPDVGTRQLAAFGEARGGLRQALELGPLGRLDGHTALSDVERRLGRLTTRDPVAGMLFADGQLGLVDDMLHYFDRTSMAYSLEVRVPFLDHRFVEFSARIPAELKVRRLTTKYLLRHAARALLPAAVVDRPKVGFFNAAVDLWFKAQTGGAILDYLLADEPAYAAFADRSEVAKVVQRHAEGKPVGRSLLTLLMLEIWLTDFLPRATAASGTRVGAAA